MPERTRAELESELPLVEESLAALERIEQQQLTQTQQLSYTRIEMQLKCLRRSLEESA